MLKKNIRRRLEIAVILIAAAIGLGYTNLTTIGVSGNNFAAQLNNDFNGTSPISPLIDTGTVIQGNVAGKSGTTADQIGTTQALAQINHEICVDGYGAVGDGATDDEPAIMSAINACGNSGCIISFDCTSSQTVASAQQGKTYLLNSYASGSNGLLWMKYSNMTIDLNGATLQAGTAPVSGGSLLLMGLSSGPGSCFETSTLFAVTGATVGSQVLTMVTPGQESNFTAAPPNNMLYIEGEHSDNLNKGDNWVTFVDTTNHKLYLREPLGRTYTPTPQVAPMNGTSGSGNTQQNCITRNITIKNGTLYTPPASAVRGMAMFFSENVLVENINQNLQNTTNAGDSPSNIGLINTVFRNNHFVANDCSVMGDMASRGNHNVLWENNFIDMHEGTGGTGCGGTINVAATGEATENITFRHNHFFNNVGNGTSTNINNGIIFGTGSVNNTADDNEVGIASGFNAGGIYDVGIGTYTGSPLAVSDHVTNNTIWMNAGRAINLRTGNPSVAVGNHIIATGSGALFVNLQEGGGIFTNNVFELDGQANGIQDNQQGWNISDNSFSNSTSGGSYAITVADFSNPSFDSTIVGNIDLTPSNFSSSGTCFTQLLGTHSNLRMSSNSPKGSCADQ